MNYTWFKIFNINEFTALGVVSKIYNLNLDGFGDVEFTAFQGNVVSVGYLDEVMPVNMYSEELYEKNLYAVYRDDNTGDVYFGFLYDEN